MPHNGFQWLERLGYVFPMFGKTHLAVLCVCAVGFVHAAEARFEFFFEPGCEACEQIEEQILPQLEPRFEIIRRDIGVESNLVYHCCGASVLSLKASLPLFAAPLGFMPISV